MTKDRDRLTALLVGLAGVLLAPVSLMYGMSVGGGGDPHSGGLIIVIGLLAAGVLVGWAGGFAAGRAS